MPATVVGLGSNLGDRLENLRRACAWLTRLAGRIQCSPVYETEPVGPPQPPFLNAAVLFDEARHPRELLRGLLAIERELGRIRSERWGPRIIDLDILWMEGVSCAEPGLSVPHASLTERSFAMRPLLDLVPDAKHPLAGERLVMPSGGSAIHRTDFDLDAPARAGLAPELD